MIALLCALGGALAFFLALGTPNAWPLAWVAPIPLLWLALGGASTRRVAVAAVAAYALGQLGMLWPYWRAMGGVMVIGAALGTAMVFALAVLAARLAARRLPAVAAMFVFPSLWTGWEVLSATFSPHGTFGAWAYSQISAPVMIQSASLFGLWVITFLIACFAAGTALTLRRRQPLPIAVALALVLANLSFGAWRLGAHPPAILKVAASARDYDRGLSPEQVATAQAAEVRRLASEGVKAIVFQEKAARLPRAQRDTVLVPMVAAARETRTMVVTGFDQTGPERRNIAYVIDENGDLRTYTKRHYIPGLEHGFTAGDGPGLLGGGKAVAICKDLDFQGTLRGDAAAARGLSVMFVPAWDFDTDRWLHARMAILRGVEGGYSLVRAAANGLVSISDARGRVLAMQASGAHGYVSVIAEVPRGSGPTLYVRIGDGFAWCAGLAGLVLVVWSLAIKKVRERPAR